MSGFDERMQVARRALRTAAVTGTNGKTTTTSMIEAIVAAAGEPTAHLTTLGAWVAGERIVAASGPAEFLATVERAVRCGVRTLALEVTSKALAGGFAEVWPPEVAVFTNLTRDHLDMHGGPEAYLAAKAQLFMALPPNGTAVLNADDEASELIQVVMPPGRTVRMFSLRDDDADLAAASVEVDRTGTHIALQPSRVADALGGRLSLSIYGRVHAQNALAAALAADALGYPGEVIRQGLAAFRTVDGRFQVIADSPLVVVDYAHTPDALDGTLRTARELVGDGGRVICVFGCGGDRDRGKRPEMGATVDALADVAVLTNDNPRREDPRAIADAVRGGVPEPRARWLEQLDRRAAIEGAITMATESDVVIIAGKGHEREQELGEASIEFSDVDVARAVCDGRA